MTPLHYALWYIKTHNDIYSRSFKKLLPHIKNLDKSSFRLPSERDPFIRQNIIEEYNQMVISGHVPRLVYTVVQKKDFKGIPLSRPPLYIGITKAGGDPIHKYARWRTHKEASYRRYHFLKLHDLGLLDFNIRRCVRLLIARDGITYPQAFARVDEYFEFIPFDIATSDRELFDLEEFFQIYINRENNFRGWDLRINMEFNRKIGGSRQLGVSISRAHLESLMEIGLRAIDIAYVLNMDEHILYDHLSLYWPDKSYKDIQTELMGDFVFGLFEKGFSFDEIRKYYLMKGTFHWSSFKVSSGINLELKSYYDVAKDYKPLYRRLSSYYVKSLYQVRADNYFKPLMISLYREGHITRYQLIDDLAQEHLERSGQSSNPVILAFFWLQELVLKLEIDLMIIDGLGYSDMVIQLGLLQPDYTAKDRRLMYRHMERLVKRIYGNVSLDYLTVLLKSRYLGDLTGRLNFYSPV